MICLRCELFVVHGRNLSDRGPSQSYNAETEHVGYFTDEAGFTERGEGESRFATDK